MMIMIDESNSDSVVGLLSDQLLAVCGFDFIGLQVLRLIFISLAMLFM
jgi:hypothetical protein